MMSLLLLCIAGGRGVHGDHVAMPQISAFPVLYKAYEPANARAVEAS